MTIGNAIQLARKKRKLTQDELAMRAEISTSYLSMLERDKRDPPLSTIRRVASGLGIPVEVLFFLGAEDNQLGSLDRELAGQLALMALDLLNESSPQKTEVL